jgi:hypothetical protein
VVDTGELAYDIDATDPFNVEDGGQSGGDKFIDVDATRTVDAANFDNGGQWVPDLSLF